MSRAPVKGNFKITAVFGQKGKYWSNGHKGVDIVNDTRVVYAPCAGTVRVVAYDPDGWGQYISIGDKEGRRHILCHLVKNGVRVRAGQAVTEQTIVGIMGLTGNTTGIHLHYELHDSSGDVIDVAKYIGCPNKVGTYNSADYENKTEESEEEEMATKVFNKVAEAPTWAKPTLQKLVDKKYLVGDDKGNLNLSEEMVRILVILDRAGNFN